MDQQSQQKVIAAGFTIIRTDDHPSPRIKYKTGNFADGRTLSKFESKAERDRRFKELLEENEDIISD